MDSNLTFSNKPLQPQQAATSNETWWRNCVIYQIYPRSFNDSDGDGVGAASTASFLHSYASAPVLVHTLNTYANGNFMSTMSPRVGAADFDIMQAASETGNAAANETIGYIAFENIGGSSTADGYQYYAFIHPQDGDEDGRNVCPTNNTGNDLPPESTNDPMS